MPVKEINNLDKLEKEVLEFVKKENLLEPGDSVLIGISGGSDSFALTQILYNISPILNLSLNLVYVEHFVRSDTYIEKENIKRFAEEKRVPLYILEIKKRSFKEKDLRDERYKLIENLAEEKNIDKIALGHTLDDVIESIIMNFLRGLGLRGLVGIPVRRGKIIRPLLNTSKAEILEYCQRNNIKYYDDFTNLLPITLRNIVRWQLIPFLKDISNQFPNSLITQKKIAEEEDKYLEKISHTYLEKIRRTEDAFEIDLPLWDEIDFPIRLRVLNHILSDLGKEFSIEAQIKIIESIDMKKHGYIGKFDIIEIYKTDRLIIKREEVSTDFYFTLEIPGRVRLPNGDVIIAEVFNVDTVKNIKFDNPFHVYFDYDKIKLDKLIIRNWKKGDRFKPFGLEGKSKKLQDFFVDKKIPKYKRDSIPLVFGDGELLWIVGLARSDVAKIDENTKKVLSIKVEKEVKN
ncbi:MAG: tRNA lysidine(34) synthetase TilS [Dictyoglomus sp. NZ13-RE01]|nr:MAG: tRNA lysidine(34) synthetase TilS [Dictyoglomus sp. NZ13-RE01]